MHISGQATAEQLRKLLAAAKSKGPSLEALPAAVMSTVPLWFESQSPYLLYEYKSTNTDS